MQPGARSGARAGVLLVAWVAALAVGACSSDGAAGSDDAPTLAPVSGGSDGSAGTGSTGGAGLGAGEPTPIDLEAAATAPVDTVDFDALYRALDAVRLEADAAEDPVLLATVSTDAARLGRLATEAADTATSWDTSDRTYVVDSVEVFDVVDEDTVVLSVIDTVTGTRYRRDTTGAVVDERSREEPSLRFLVLVERSTGAWKIAYDVFGLPAQVPLPAREAFQPVATVTVEGQEVGLSVAGNGQGLSCFLVGAAAQAPQVGCAFDSASAQSALYLFRAGDDSYEALVAIHTLDTAEAVGVVEPGLRMPADQQIGTWHVGFVAAGAGTMQSFTWDGVTPPDGAGTIALDGLRAQLRPGEPVLG